MRTRSTSQKSCHAELASDGGPRARWRSIGAPVYFLCVAAWFWACGGSTASTPAEHGEGTQTSPEGAVETVGESETTDTASRLPSCEDGTCFTCGETVCLSGFYCDEAAKSGAACSWLPECASKPSCHCLTKQLGTTCTCEERSGGPHVTCSD